MSRTKKAVGVKVKEQNSFTEAQKQEFLECERKLETNQRNYIAVGEALATILEKLLYKQSYSDFDVYCEERWGFTGSHARRLIDAFKVIAKLRADPELQSEDKLPCNEHQVRILKEAKQPHHWIRVWKSVVKAAKKQGGVITAKLVREIVQTKPAKNGEAKAKISKAVSSVSEPIQKALELVQSAKEKVSDYSLKDWNKFLAELEKILGQKV